eukprot:c15096_g1_i5.p1 GENE.c15096_g1_i5~~c15096_g1_i5.p1  ORF type:complete len:109 (+),score=18.05 c15096_g1_i5:27-329(+)
MTESANEKLSKEKVKDVLHQKLIRSSENERIKENLRKQLVESGWYDNLKKHTEEVIRTKGITNLSQLVTEITPHGRASIPDHVKHSLFASIVEFVEGQQQ